MENLKENKRIRYIWSDKNFSRDTINKINHTSINNNINITNYYPSPSQDYCNNEAFTIINKNGNEENVISYPIKINTNINKSNKDSSPRINNLNKKYHQYKSPYMKKILPSAKREKSEEGNRIIYNNSSSSTCLKTSKNRKIIQYINNNDNISLKSEILKNNSKLNIKENYYLDLSSDDINNKFINKRNNNKHFYYNNSEKNNFKNFQNKTQNEPNYNNNNSISKSVISFESNGKENVLNLFEKPIQICVTTKEPLYRISSNYKYNNISYNLTSPKYVKSQKNLINKYNKGIVINKKIIDYIILIQSVIRGFLLRIKLSEYLTLYETIKTGISFIQNIIYERIKNIFYFIFINNKLL